MRKLFFKSQKMYIFCTCHMTYDMQSAWSGSQPTWALTWLVAFNLCPQLRNTLPASPPCKYKNCNNFFVFVSALKMSHSWGLGRVLRSATPKIVMWLSLAASSPPNSPRELAFHCCAFPFPFYLYNVSRMCEGWVCASAGAGVREFFYQSAGNTCG